MRFLRLNGSWQFKLINLNFDNKHIVNLAKQLSMEAIKAIAKRTKSGNYKIDLPINNDATEIAVMVIVENGKVEKKKKSLADFAGKMKSNIDWVAYQKKIRNEWI